MSFRLDRFAALYLAQPIRRVWSEMDTAIPILMYHSISDDGEGGAHPYYRTSTSPSTFAVQMQLLRDQGYRTISPHDIAARIANFERDFAKNVVITFDDGYRDFYIHAFPVLQSLGFTATVYLPTAFIRDQTATFKGKECLTWSEVRELHRAGILFGSHTVNHPQLRELNFAKIDEEICHSKDNIEQELGVAINSFAYPYAFPQADHEFKTALAHSLRRFGYRNGVCTAIGRASRKSEPLFLERLPVNGCDDPALFSAKLSGAYDWISVAQRIFKAGKRKFKKPMTPANSNHIKELPTVQRPL